MYKRDFIQLVRLGVGCTADDLSQSINWSKIRAVAACHGLSAIVLDGVERLLTRLAPPKAFLLQWIGEVLQRERTYSVKQESTIKLAKLFHENAIRTYELKGGVVSECYPKPDHRPSVDLDCFLLPVGGDFDAWELANDLIRTRGYKVNRDFYKNSTFVLPGLTVENHKYMTPFRGNKRLERLEKLLQSLIREDKGENKMESTWIYRPPVMLTSLFLIEHAYSHFLHEGLTWRHVLDWMMFSRKHKDEIEWDLLNKWIDEYGFRRFYDSFYRLGQYLLGDIDIVDLTKRDRKMLKDVWADLDLHETLHGVKGKLSLAGNTWRARWKYHYFSEISMLHALWIQVKGFLFIREVDICG